MADIGEPAVSEFAPLLRVNLVKAVLWWLVLFALLGIAW